MAAILQTTFSYQILYLIRGNHPSVRPSVLSRRPDDFPKLGSNFDLVRWAKFWVSGYYQIICRTHGQIEGMVSYLTCWWPELIQNWLIFLTLALFWLCEVRQTLRFTIASVRITRRNSHNHGTRNPDYVFESIRACEAILLMLCVECRQVIQISIKLVAHETNYVLRKLPRATTNVQKNKSYVGLFISYVGLFISYVGLIKSYVGLYNSYVGDKIS